MYGAAWGVRLLERRYSLLDEFAQWSGYFRLGLRWCFSEKLTHERLLRSKVSGTGWMRTLRALMPLSDLAAIGIRDPGQSLGAKSLQVLTQSTNSSLKMGLEYIYNLWTSETVNNCY